jgi:hypothetical protein
MNERIRELAWQAANGMLSYDAEGDFRLSEKEVEKFAELIVKECENVSLKNSHRNDDMGAIIARQIKQHFGMSNERTNS